MERVVLSICTRPSSHCNVATSSFAFSRASECHMDRILQRAGSDLRRIADDFSRTPARQEVRRMAEKVFISALNWESFSSLCISLFQVRFSFLKQWFDFTNIALLITHRSYSLSSCLLFWGVWLSADYATILLGKIFCGRDSSYRIHLIAIKDKALLLYNLCLFRVPEG